MLNSVRASRKRRTGCLGCITSSVLALLLGALAIGAVTALFAPWAFFMGGSFHLLAMWSGWGTLQAKSGKYVVYVDIGPRPNRYATGISGTSLGGNGYLCSPRGEIFRMHLTGGMRRGLSVNTDGEKITLGMTHYPIFRMFSGPTDSRPSIEIRGQWHNPNIVADDHGSISRNFNSDGTVDSTPNRNHPYPGDITSVTLVPGSYSDFKAACQAR